LTGHIYLYIYTCKAIMRPRINSSEGIERFRIAFNDFLLEKNLTLEKAALILNVSPGTLSLFKNGKTKPFERTIYRIKKLIGETWFGS